MNPDQLPIYAVVTKSHADMMERWFLKTLPAGCVPFIHPMAAEPVSFRSGHWHTIFIEKIRLILEAIEKHRDSMIVASDVDIQFFRPIASELRTLIEGYDVLFQNSTPQNKPSLSNLCAGFTVIRCGDPAKRFFEEGLRRVVTRNHGSYDDQVAYQEICAGKTEARIGLLPSTYWTCGRIWFPDHPLDVPPDIAIHHAAWIIGNPGKELQLRKVREIVEART